MPKASRNCCYASWRGGDRTPRATAPSYGLRLLWTGGSFPIEAGSPSASAPVQFPLHEIPDLSEVKFLAAVERPRSPGSRVRHRVLPRGLPLRSTAALPAAFCPSCRFLCTQLLEPSDF